MIATIDTATSLRFEAMRSGLHNKNAQAILSASLKAVFSKRGLSARGVARAIGNGLSNKTVSNMLNGVGAPQLDRIAAVADYLRIPLWQLLCPGIDPSHFGNEDVHRLVESFAGLSEIGKARLMQALEDAVLGENARRPQAKHSAS